MQPGHWIVVTLIIAWAAVVLGAMWQANQRALQRHRERLASIEKGLPLPVEPTAVSPWHVLRGPTPTNRGAEERRLLEFIRFVGTLTVAAGVGLYFLLTMLGQWEAGVGFGGMTVIVGIALILTTVRALRVERHHPSPTED
jgi:hypothetical protein